MNKLASVAITATFFALSGAAHASTLDYTLGNTPVPPPGFDNVSLSGSTGSDVSGNVLLSTPSPISLTANSSITNTVNPNTNIWPGPPGLNTLYGGNYLAVQGNGAATFTLTGNNFNTFAFEWGTVDTYNSLIITDARGVKYELTGTEILNDLMSQNLPHVSGQTTTGASFTDPYAAITSVQFDTSQNSFESANFFEAATPLPASLPLFAAALLGLVFFAQRRKSLSKV